uniref:Myopalladin n=1 Tax=Chinchilla lanigera TaxID=34839 RepID=A0A8C2VIG8_CHILA
MQDDSLEASTSISQLLRESYLAETRHGGQGERSRAEPSACAPLPGGPPGAEPLGRAPRFAQKLRSREVPEGSRVQLDCVVVGIPPPQVRWYCEGKELENSPDIQIIQAGNLHSLTIAEAFEEDTGRYSCFASNIYGTDSTSAEIYIEGVSSSDSEGDPNKDEMNRIQKPNEVSLPPTTSAAIPPAAPPAPHLVAQPRVTTIQQCQSPTNYLQGLDGKPIIAAPVFTKMLQNLSASEGQLVVFECRVKGAPSPKVEWYREGTLIEDSPDFRILQKKPRSMAEPEEICTLVIAEVFAEDSGCFTCTASNKYGTVSSVARLDVRGNEDLSNNGALHPANSTSNLATSEPQAALPSPEPPSAEQPPKPKLEGVLVNHNEPRSSSRAGLRVHFNLPEDDKGSEASSEGNVATASQTRPDCFPERFNGQAVKSPEPSSPVKEPPPVLAKPKLSAPAGPSQGLMKKNTKSSQPVSDDYIRETKNAVILDLGKKMSFSDARSNQQEYKISSFEQRLMNEIEFRLERTPVDESDDEIQHDEIPTGKCIAPIFDKRLKHFRVTEGSPVTFTCKIVGIPVPKVGADGQPVDQPTHRTTDSTFKKKYSLGRISCSGHLMVQGMPIRSRLTAAGQSHRARSRLQERDREPLQERFFRPHFLQAPGDMVAHEGRLCRLDCKVSGLPPPELTWLLNGQPVLPDASHKMLVRETGVHSLLIDPLTQRDAGTYTCVATNKTGQNSFSLELTVVAKEVKKAPVILEKLQNSGVPEGHPVRLECRVIGMPPPVFYWKKDNETIPFTRERVSMHQDTTGYVCLLIQPAKKSDAGWYTLSAKNEAGIVSCTARLDIYAQWHQQIPPPMSVRPSGSRYGSLTGKGLDIFSAFSSVESTVLYSCSSSVVESDEL